MHATRSLEDSNYGIRSIDSSFSDDYDNQEEEGSDSSGGSTVHLDLSPSSSTLSPSSTPPPIQPQPQPPSNVDLPSYGPLQESQGANTILDSLPRGAFLSSGSHSHPSAPPPRLPLPLLPLPTLSSTSSPICLSPPLSPVNSYSSLSSSSPPEMSHYLSDSVSSLGSLENDLSASSTSAASSLRSRSRRPNERDRDQDQDQGGGSNGNLVLPTLSLQEEEGGVELELRKAEEEAGNAGGLLRIVVVAGKEKERDLLVERLALELGVVELGEKSTEEREGWVGRTGVRKKEEGDDGSSSVRREVWLGSSGSDLASVESLLQHVRSRHLPLSQQLSPRSEPPSLRPRDVLELAATGKGRGQRGWIDCCVVAVDQEDSPSQALSAARVLSSFTPTLLVLLQSTATTALGAELTSSLQHLELVSPTLVSPLATTSSPRSNLLLLDRNSLLHPDEIGSEGLPTPQPGNTDDPFSFPSCAREDQDSAPSPSSSASFPEGLQTLFSTEKGLTYLHRFAARGFMRSRAALVVPSPSLASSITSDSDNSSSYPPRTRTKPTLTPLDIEEPDPASFDPLHLPSALSTLLVPSLRSFTTFVLEGFAIIGIGMISVVAQSVLLGVVGEVARRLDLRGAFVARTRWGRC